MRLNPDCIRDILLIIEAESLPGHIITADAFQPLADRYTAVEVSYHLKQSEMAGLVIKYFPFPDGYFTVSDLTPKGHEFIENIRQDNNWNKVKSIAKKAGSFSLSVLTSSASSVIADSLKDIT